MQMAFAAVFLLFASARCNTTSSTRSSISSPLCFNLDLETYLGLELHLGLESLTSARHPSLNLGFSRVSSHTIP